MATIALRAPRARRLASAGLGLPLLLGLAGIVLNSLGGSWDVSWHRMLGRDTFWSPPHQALYGGVALWGIAALYATLTAMGGRPPRTAELRLGPLHAELGLALVGLGTAAVILSAPFDDAWHRAFGRDVDIWSPPHLLAVAAVLVALVGWALALAPGVFPIGERARVALRAFVIGDIAGVLGFGMNFYYFMASTRDALFYPLVVAAIFPAALAFAVVLLPVRWPATSAAAAHLAIGVTVVGVLRATGWASPAFPPLLIAGAAAIDIARRRGGLLASPLVIGALFTITLVAAEAARTLLVPPPPPAPPLDDLRAFGLFMQYYAQTQVHPWASAWPVAAVALGTPVAALSWIAGTRIARALVARSLREQLQGESVAHP